MCLSTLQEVRDAKQLKRTNEVDGLMQYKNMSSYVIKNALTHKHMPLADNLHEPYSMMPPEMLHTSGSGLIKYIFKSLKMQIGGSISCDEIDKMHITVNLSIKSQSERDFPRGAMRNGILLPQSANLKRGRVIYFYYYVLPIPQMGVGR